MRPRHSTRDDSFGAKSAAAVIFATLLWMLVMPIATRPLRWQWDFAVYYFAASAPALGLNPYSEMPQVPGFPPHLHFVYPPLIGWAARPFTMLSYLAATRVYLALKLAALFGLLWLLVKRFLADSTAFAFAVFALLAFRGALWLDVQTGNISTFEQLALWSGFFFLLDGRLWAFCACVVFASMFKIVPVVFLAALLLSPEPRRFRCLVASVSVFALVMLAQYVIAPAEFGAFLSNVSTIQEGGAQANPSALAFAQDAVTELQRLTTGRVWPLWVPFAAWATFAAVVTGLTARTLNRERLDGSARDLVRIALLCAGAALILPRFKTYSYALLLMPAWIAARFVARGRPWVFAACLVMLCISDIEPFVRLAGVVGASIAPRTAAWRYLPLVQASLVWLALLVAVPRAALDTSLARIG